MFLLAAYLRMISTKNITKPKTNNVLPKTLTITLRKLGFLVLPTHLFNSASHALTTRR
jgi:hypothetical protein